MTKELKEELKANVEFERSKIRFIYGVKSVDNFDVNTWYNEEIKKLDNVRQS